MPWLAPWEGNGGNANGSGGGGAGVSGSSSSYKGEEEGRSNEALTRAMRGTPAATTAVTRRGPWPEAFDLPASLMRSAAGGSDGGKDGAGGGGGGGVIAGAAGVVGASTAAAWAEIGRAHV